MSAATWRVIRSRGPPSASSTISAERPKPCAVEIGARSRRRRPVADQDDQRARRGARCGIAASRSGRRAARARGRFERASRAAPRRARRSTARGSARHSPGQLARRECSRRRTRTDRPRRGRRRAAAMRGRTGADIEGYGPGASALGADPREREMTGAAEDHSARAERVAACRGEAARAILADAHDRQPGIRQPCRIAPDPRRHGRGQPARRGASPQPAIDAVCSYAGRTERPTAPAAAACASAGSAAWTASPLISAPSGSRMSSTPRILSPRR